MNIEKYWSKALKNTEIRRQRIAALLPSSDTKVPYIMLSESVINQGDTVVRKGEVLVQKPSLIVPPNNPQLSGFEFEEEDANEDAMVNYLLLRGVSIPSMHYNNQTSSLDVFEDKLSKAIKHYQDTLQREENVKTGLIIGPEDCWQFSLLIFICTQVAKNADHDIKRLIDEYKNRGG